MARNKPIPRSQRNDFNRGTKISRNSPGAKDDVIEGDKAAGSYDKIMITDVAISLSRKKEDKVNGTGRFHIMKNRYGMDGMTYNIKMDTNNGHIQFEGKVSNDVNDGESLVSPHSNKAKKFFSLDGEER